MMAASARLNINLGPVPYLWKAEDWRDFYFRIADEAPLDGVTLGEVVCSKRAHFIQPHMAAVVDRLQRAGKSITLASLAVVTLEREAAMTRKLGIQTAHPVEANDLSALGLLGGRPHAIGPFVNVYNAAAARMMAGRGATRICLSPELPATSVVEIVAGAPGVDFEIFAFGKLPLAISARCAHARSKGHSKDNCRFVCGEDPDGLPVKTLDGQSFLTLNGVQTMSHTCQVLLGELPGIRMAGVSHIRLSPQSCDMVAVARIFADVRDGRTDAAEGLVRLGIVYPKAPFSNGFHHGRPGAGWVDAVATGKSDAESPCA